MCVCVCLLRFVEAYEAAGADMWGLTTQNEPLSGFDEVSCTGERKKIRLIYYVDSFQRRLIPHL